MNYINYSAQSCINFLLCSSIRYLYMFSRPHLSQSLIKFIQVSVAVLCNIWSKHGRSGSFSSTQCRCRVPIEVTYRWWLSDKMGDTQLRGTREEKAKARMLPHSVLIKEGFFSKKMDLSHPGLVWRGDAGRTFFIRGEDAGHLWYCGCTYPPLKWANILFGAFKRKFLEPNLALFLKGRRGEGRGKHDDGGSRGNLGLILLGCPVQQDFMRFHRGGWLSFCHLADSFLSWVLLDTEQAPQNKCPTYLGAGNSVTAVAHLCRYWGG